MLKKICFLSAALVFLLALTACHPTQDAHELRVGTITGPETQLMVVAKQVAFKRYGLRLNIIEFSDYAMPNIALSDGGLQANMFQHQAFLDEEIRNKHYKLVPVAKLFVYPMAIYSKKIKALSMLKPHAIVAIPNDPSNEARALLLLQQAHLITLRSKMQHLATPYDILANPKHLQIKELDAAQLTRVLPDVDCAVINANYAILNNLYPRQDALFSENGHSAYANLLVVRERDRDDTRLKQLASALHSPEVLAAAKTLFHNQAIPAWK